MLTLPSLPTAQAEVPPGAKELARQLPPRARLAALARAAAVPPCMAAGVVAPKEKAARSAKPRAEPGALGERRRREKVESVKNLAPPVSMAGSVMPQAGGSLPQRTSRKVPDSLPWQQSPRG